MGVLLFALPGYRAPRLGERTGTPEEFSDARWSRCRPNRLFVSAARSWRRPLDPAGRLPSRPYWPSNTRCGDLSSAAAYEAHDVLHRVHGPARHDARPFGAVRKDAVDMTLVTRQPFHLRAD